MVSVLQSHFLMGVIATAEKIKGRRLSEEEKRRCNPIFLWELLLLERWIDTLETDERELQSHFLMGVIATQRKRFTLH